MSSKRVGLADRDNNKRNRLNVLFAPSDNTKNDEMLVSESKETKTEAIAEETHETEKPEEPKKKQKSAAFRQTYYMSPDVVEAIRIMSFETREGISSIVNRLLKDSIPQEVLSQASQNLTIKK